MLGAPVRLRCEYLTNPLDRGSGRNRVLVGDTAPPCCGLQAGMKEEERPGGAWPLNLDNYLASDRSADAFWSTALRSPALVSLPEMRVSASTTVKIVNAPWLRAGPRRPAGANRTRRRRG